MKYQLYNQDEIYPKFKASNYPSASNNELVQRANIMESELDSKLAFAPILLQKAYQKLIDSMYNKGQSYFTNEKEFKSSFKSKEMNDLTDIIQQMNLYAGLIARLHSKREMVFKMEDAQVMSPAINFAINDLLQRGVMTRSEFDTLSDLERLKAFTVARVSAMDMLRAIQAKITEGIAQGYSFTQWENKMIQDGVVSSGFAAEQPWHMENIYRTNVGAAYSAGRAMQIQRDMNDIKCLVWITEGTPVDMGGAVCEICWPLNNYTAPPDDEIWLEYWPLLHHFCRCKVLIIYNDNPDADQYEFTNKNINVTPEEGFDASAMNFDYGVDPTTKQKAMDYGIEIDEEAIRELLKKLENMDTEEQ